MKNNIDGARIYAENAIRKQKEANNFLKLAARIDSVASKMEQAEMMKSVTKVVDHHKLLTCQTGNEKSFKRYG